MIKRLMGSITGLFRSPGGRIVVLAIYYLAIILGLILMYGRGDFVPREFIYQGF